MHRPSHESHHDVDAPPKQRNENSYQVVDENDIKEEWFKGVDTVGISAGASTPDNIISNVIEKINSISNLNSKEEIYE